MNKSTKSMFILLLTMLAMMFTSLVTAQSVPTDFGWGLGALIGGTLCIVFVVIWIVFILIAIWVYRDAEKRGKSGALWLIIVILTGIIGLIIWLIVRPPIKEKPK